MPNKKKEIIGLVPAAGKGSRLLPFPCPKELFPVGYQDYFINGQYLKRPKVISQYLIENMINAGASRIIIILGEDKYDIIRYYGDGARFGISISYLYQEKLWGMPYALNLAKNWVENSTIIFGMPDTIIEPKISFTNLLNFHLRSNSDLTLGLFKTQNPSKFGMVDFDSNNKVISVIDKPKETQLKYMWGFACWSPAFTNFLGEFLIKNNYSGKEVVLGDVFNDAIQQKLSVMAIPFKDGKYIDIGTADELNSALKKFHL